MLVLLVTKLRLSNRIDGQNVLCPECHKAISEKEIKYVAHGEVRHANCHLVWRQGHMQENVHVDVISSQPQQEQVRQYGAHSGNYGGSFSGSFCSPKANPA